MASVYELARSRIAGSLTVEVEKRVVEGTKPKPGSKERRKEIWDKWYEKLPPERKEAMLATARQRASERYHRLHPDAKYSKHKYKEVSMPCGGKKTGGKKPPKK